MDMYQYFGRNRRGEPMRGTVESASPQAVATWLLSSEIFPVEIGLVQQGADRPEWMVKLFGHERISSTELLLFTRQMGNMMRAGMQVMDAVDGIAKTTSSRALSRVLASIRADLDRGSLLSVAFARHPEAFDEYYTNMIRVGEGAGKLADAFKSLYHQVEFNRSMKQRMKSAMRYPSFVLIALTLAIAVLTIYVIPSFAKTYSQLKVQLPLVTRILMGTSQFVIHYWWAVLLAVGLSIYLFRRYVAQPDGRYAWDRFKLRIPVAGRIAHKAAVARFARSFATALHSGVPIVQAFQLCATVAENAMFEARILQMRRGIERGEVLSRVMRTAGIFSPLELQLITVAEKTGEVEQAVGELAKLYTEEVEFEVSRLTQTVEPLLLAGMGLLVGIVVLGVFLPMWDMSQIMKAH
jgi:MSHA biogenesis protein MshG